jgi:hypothetical protein
MRAMQMKSVWGGVAAGALLFTVGCGATQNTPAVRAQDAAAAPVSPVVVSCEPHQRTLVRPAMVNGQAVSQVECVAADPQAAALAQASAAQAFPAAYQVAQPAAPVVYRDLAPAQVVPVREVYQAPRQAARPVRTRHVVYDEPVRVQKQGRSVKKSAVIIGSSAGVGAGVGAAVGGKKGALIGAAIGGGGAAIWDQITRR